MELFCWFLIFPCHSLTLVPMLLSIQILLLLANNYHSKGTKTIISYLVIPWFLSAPCRVKNQSSIIDISVVQELFQTVVTYIKNCCSRIVHMGMDRAFREIISPVVECSVTIACMTTHELVTKVISSFSLTYFIWLAHISF